jgi:hypothetical protein
MPCVLVAELVRRTEEEESNDPEWFGSAAHLNLVREFASSRIDGATVAWGVAGRRSSALGRDLVIEAPTRDRDDPVRAHAALVLHEVMHGVHSKAGVGADIPMLLRQYPTYLQKLVPLVFNWLEDARMSTRERELVPENGEYVRLLCDLAVGDERELYETRFGESPWTTTPASVLSQLNLALEHRILLGELPAPLLPVVATIMQEIGPIVDTAMAGADTDAAELGAYQIIDVIDSHLDELKHANSPA